MASIFSARKENYYIPRKNVLWATENSSTERILITHILPCILCVRASIFNGSIWPLYSHIYSKEFIVAFPPSTIACWRSDIYVLEFTESEKPNTISRHGTVYKKSRKSADSKVLFDVSVKMNLFQIKLLGNCMILWVEIFSHSGYIHLRNESEGLWNMNIRKLYFEELTNIIRSHSIPFNFFILIATVELKNSWSFSYHKHRIAWTFV